MAVRGVWDYVIFIGSGYSTDVYDGNRPLLPILRQKMALSDLCLPDGCLYGDRNTWNTIPISGQKITLSKNE
jgi:hypothetical protein